MLVKGGPGHQSEPVPDKPILFPLIEIISYLVVHDNCASISSVKVACIGYPWKPECTSMNIREIMQAIDIDTVWVIGK